MNTVSSSPKATDATQILPYIVNNAGDLKLEIRKHRNSGNFYITLQRTGKRVMFLNFNKVLELYDNIQDVNATLQDVIDGDIEAHYRYHLGRHVYISVDSPYVGVNIRSWFRPGGDVELKPGLGVFINPEEWRGFQHVFMNLQTYIPEIASAKRCSDIHHGQQSMLECLECNPDGYDM